jgi:hypothetical protein
MLINEKYLLTLNMGYWFYASPPALKRDSRIHPGKTRELMKRIFIVLAIALLTTGLLFASPSWIGVQGTGSFKQGESGSEDHTIIPVGLNIAGTMYLGEAPIGIGFQAGFAKTAIHKRDGEELEVKDYPLTWNIGAAGKFRLGMSDLLALELGAGLMNERYARTGEVLGSDYVINFDTLSAVLASDVVVHLSDSLAMVGGVNAAFPLTGKIGFALGF